MSTCTALAGGTGAILLVHSTPFLTDEPGHPGRRKIPFAQIVGGSKQPSAACLLYYLFPLTLLTYVRSS